MILDLVLEGATKKNKHKEEKNKKKAHNQEFAKRMISNSKAKMKLRHSVKDIGVCFTSAVVLVSDDIPLDVLQLGAGNGA